MKIWLKTLALVALLSTGVFSFAGSVNTHKLDALETLTGETGSVNDLERIYVAQLAEETLDGDDSINDLWHAFWDDENVPGSSFNTRAYNWLGSLSYTGSLNSRWHAFWEAGGQVLSDFFTLLFNTGTIVPETTETVTTSFTRATPSSVTTVDGREGVQIGSGEVPFVGHDRIENLYSSDMSAWNSSAVTVTEVTGSVTPPSEVSADTRVWRIQGAAASSATINESFDVDDAAVSFYVKAVSPGSSDTFRIRSDTVTETPDLTATGNWQRFGVVDVGSTPGSRSYGINDDGSANAFDLYVVGQLEDVTGKPNKAPGQYTSVGVGVQPDILTSAITASDWVLGNVASVTDAEDGSVEFTSDSPSQYRQIALGLLFPVLQSDTASTWVIEYRAKISSGAMTIAMNEETPAYSQSVSNTSYENYSAVFSYDGFGTITLTLGALDSGETANLEFLSIRKADHGANVDGVKYSPYWNPRYVDSSNVVQNDSATGELISSSNNRFANVVTAGGSNFLTQADADSLTDSQIFIFEGALEDFANGATQQLFRQWGTSQKKFNLSVTGTGVPALFVSEDGTNDTFASSSTALSVSDGEFFRLAAVYNADPTTPTVDWYFSKESWTTTPASANWILHESGDTFANAANANTLNNSTADYEMLGGAGFGGIKGRFYRAYIINGVDFTTTPTVSLTPSSVTANGNAYVYTPPDPAVRISEARTNLWKYSEDITNAAYVSSNTANVADYAVAPDGTTTASRIIDDSSTGSGLVTIGQNHVDFGTIAASTDYTFSVYAKADQLSWISLESTGFDAAGTGATYFNLKTGATGTVSVNHTAHVERLPDGWVRCGITFQSTTDLDGTINIYVSDGDVDVTVDHDGTSSLLVWGFQFEQGSYPTGYIKADASAVARNADVLTYTGFDLPMPFTYVATVALPENDGRFIGLSDGTITDRVAILTTGGASGSPTAYVMTNSVIGSTLSVGTGLTAGAAYQFAHAVAENDTETFRDGVSVATDTSVNAFADNMTTVLIGRDAAGLYANGADISVVKVYDTRLTEIPQ